MTRFCPGTALEVNLRVFPDESVVDKIVAVATFVGVDVGSNACSIGQR